MSASADQAIEDENDDRADDRREKSSWLPVLIPAERTAKESCDEGARNSEKDGDDPPARVTTWHQEFRDSSDEESDNDC